MDTNIVVFAIRLDYQFINESASRTLHREYVREILGPLDPYGVPGRADFPDSPASARFRESQPY